MSESTRKSARPRVTVVIVSWNAWHHLEPCVASVMASKFCDLEILVIDNASDDGSAEKVARAFPGVRVVRNAENHGHSHAVNQGFRAARGEMVLVLDADTVCAKEAIGEMVRFLDEHPAVDLVAPRTFNSDGTIQETARRFPDAFSGLFGRQSLLTQIFPNNRFTRRYLQRDSLELREPFRVESVASSCMLLRRSLVERVGEWDEGFPGYFVETDWCYRLKRKGVLVYCMPSARIVHHEGNRRTRKRGARRIWMFHRGAFRFYRKNRTFGWFDPRTYLAFSALVMRAGLLIVADALKVKPQEELRREDAVRASDVGRAGS